jgi:hypothetical protein
MLVLLIDLIAAAATRNDLTADYADENGFV